MIRWVWLIGCAILGLVMLMCGLLMPVHLRAVDAGVIERAGRRAPSLVEAGVALVKRQEVGPAELLWRAAQSEGIRDQAKLGLAISDLGKVYPNTLFWGVADSRLENLLGNPQRALATDSSAVTVFIVREENRGKVLAFLSASLRFPVQELMRCRALTNTVLFPPSQSASGQAMDTAIAIGGLLLVEERLTPALRDALVSLAAEASKGGSSQRFEQALMDFLSLGQRFNWGQLVAFVGRIEDTETLRCLARQAGEASNQLPALFSAVFLSGKPAAVAKYLMTFSQTGLKDLGAGLRSGIGGLDEILERNQRLYHPRWRQFVAGYDPFAAFYFFAADYCGRVPWLALFFKWLFYLSGGFLLAAALHYFTRAVPVLERPLQVRGFHVAREILFALGFLLVVLLLSEPFLTQESQKVELPFRLRLPMMGSAVPAGTNPNHSTLMNQLSLLTLLLFFVLQALIYTACLFRLAEVRRQNLPPRIKLKLLDNEDHLFDAGLYLGFVGTIISLILVSMGVIKPSLMAAYSSTSFGIIFCSIFKIFHLRPVRRKLLLQAEGMSDESGTPAASAKSVLPS